MASTTSVFISYRRDDCAPWAGRVYDQLVTALGRTRVFMDIDSIAPGREFEGVLSERMAQCNVCLPIIGPAWIDARIDGRRRLDDEKDFVRLEIETALKRGARVIPILVENARMPAPEDLPDPLKPLALQQPIVLTHHGFRSNINAIVAAVSPQREGDLSRSGLQIALAGAFAVLAPVAVDRLGDEVASRFLDFGKNAMDMAEGIVGQLIVFAVMACLGAMLFWVRKGALTAQEQTLYRVGFALLVAAIVQDGARVFIFAFTGSGLAKPGEAVAMAIAYVFMFAAIFLIFSKRASALSHIEWLVSAAAAAVWVYLSSGLLYPVIKTNYFEGLDDYLEGETLQAGIAVCTALVVALLALAVGRRRSAFA